jgi:hypothetical protein
LVEPEAPDPEPQSQYDEDRDLTLLGDGTPLVEAITRFAGTSTFTKNNGEHSDADEATCFLGSAGTMTSTAINAEREDDDAQARWGSTQLDTRRLPGDVEQD